MGVGLGNLNPELLVDVGSEGRLDEVFGIADPFVLKSVRRMVKRPVQPPGASACGLGGRKFNGRLVRASPGGSP